MFIINPYRFSTSSSFVGPYDSYTTNGAAYSLRRMYSTYSSTSPIIAVSRTIGPTTVEADVRVDSSTNYISLNSPITITSGSSSSTTLGELAGLGSNPDGIVSGTTNINVKTWYDQSNNGRHAIQTNLNIRPFIVTNGVLETDGGEVAVRFVSGNSLVYSSGSFTPAGTTLFSLAKNTTSNISHILGIFLVPGTIDFFGYRGSSATNSGIVGRTTTSSSTSVNTPAPPNIEHKYYGRWRASDGRLEIGADGNAVAVTSGSISTTAAWIGIGIGTAASSLTATFVGYQKEHLVFFSDQSANRTTIETILNTY